VGEGLLSQAATWAGGAHSAQRRNPPGLKAGPTHLSCWIASDGLASKSGDQKPLDAPAGRNPSFISHRLILSLCLGSSLSPHRKAKGDGAPCSGRRGNGAAPKPLAGARALRWMSAPPSRGFECVARARCLTGWPVTESRAAAWSPRPVSVLVSVVGDPAAVRGGPRQR
jgi:hypothetical protein